MSTFTIISNNNNAPTSSIVWSDTETTENRVGVFSSVSIGADSIIDIEGSTIYSLWQINLGSGFVDNIFLLANPQTFNITAGITQFRLKNTDAFGMVGYSNILQYSYNPPIYDNYYGYYGEIQAAGFSNLPNFNISFGSGHFAINQLGLNYAGAMPNILRILSYTSIATEFDEFGNNLGNISGYVSPIITTLGNVPITFPYNIPMSSFSVAVLPIKTINTTFPTIPYLNILEPVISTFNNTNLINIIEYEVIDINGNSGGVKTSNIISTYNVGGITPPPPPPPPNPTYPLSGYNVCFKAGVSDCVTNPNPNPPTGLLTYINVYGIITNTLVDFCIELNGVIVPGNPILVHQIISGQNYVNLC